MHNAGTQVSFTKVVDNWVIKNCIWSEQACKHNTCTPICTRKVLHLGCLTFKHTAVVWLKPHFVAHKINTPFLTKKVCNILPKKLEVKFGLILMAAAPHGPQNSDYVAEWSTSYISFLQLDLLPINKYKIQHILEDLMLSEHY